MSTIVKFFKWLGNGILSFVTWFVGLPAVIISAVTGLWASLSELWGSLVSGGSFASQWVGVAENGADSLSQAMSSVPDVVKVACYALSMDTLFTYIISTYAVFITLSLTVLAFFFVSIPAFVISMYAIKFSAWFLSAIFPRSFVPSAIIDLSSINIVSPIRQAVLKDGKYNPFLGG